MKVPFDNLDALLRSQADELSYENGLMAVHQTLSLGVRCRHNIIKGHFLTHLPFKPFLVFNVLCCRHLN
jgi:hypothetical protein